MAPQGPRAASAVGVLSEYDGEKLSFVLRPHEGARVTCVLEHYNEPLAQRAREYLALDGITAPDVRVEGETLDDEDRVRRIFNVHGLEVVWTIPEKVIVHRLRALTKLKPGWLGPGSGVPSPALAELLEPVVSDLASMGLPVSIVANTDGAFVLEWRAGDVEYTAEVDATGSLYMCADNVVNDDLADAEIPFDVDVLRRFVTTGAMQ